MSTIKIKKAKAINPSTKEMGYITRVVNRENLTMEQLAKEAEEEAPEEEIPDTL